MKNPKYLAVLLGITCMLITSFQSANAQVQTARFISMTPNTKAFYEYLPQGYSATGTQKYPLILFVHGMGELGAGTASTLSGVLRNGVPKVINSGKFPTSFTVNGQTHKFIVISPQFVAWPKPADIDAVINYAIANYNVDPTRVYMTGLSMGGGITWEYAGNQATNAYAQRLAGIAPICGASYPSIYRAVVLAKNNVPVWAFHNEGDPTAPVYYTNDYISGMNSQIPAPNPLGKKTIFPVSGHDAWSKAYDPLYRENGMNVYEWMLQYSRGGVTPPPPTNTAPVANAGTDQAITLPTNSVQLTGTGTDANGTIASYNWSKTAGPTQFAISNAAIANPTVSNLVAGTYTFRLTVTDNQGATATDNINVVVSSITTPPPPPPPPTTGTKYIKVNLFGGSNAYSNAEWNNWNTNTTASRTSAPFKYTDGTTSAINAVLSQQNAVSDNGSSFTTTMAPKEVGRYASYSTSNRTLTISGLTNGRTYSLELYASRSGVSNNTTRFAIGTTTIDIKTDNNLANKATFTVVPTNGSIVLNISKLTTYNYLNGFMLTEVGTSTTSAAAATESSISAMSVETTSTGIDVFPNPVEDRFVLQVANTQTGQMKVQIVDMTGNIQKEFSLSKTQTGTSQTYLSIGDLSAGEYIIKVQLGTWSDSKKISKL